jgi:hypothetical protein
MTDYDRYLENDAFSSGRKAASFESKSLDSRTPGCRLVAMASRPQGWIALASHNGVRIAERLLFFWDNDEKTGG